MDFQPKIVHRDSVTFAVFLATLLSSYRGCLCSFRRLLPNKRYSWAHAFLAGFFAGTTMLLDTSRSRRKAIALYVFTRTCFFVSQYAMQKWSGHRRKVRLQEMERLKFEFSKTGGLMGGEERRVISIQRARDDHIEKFLRAAGPTVTMMAASCQIMYAFVRIPESLPVSAL